ncbi:sugar transferase [Aerococcus urinae]|uniref:Sugar transferase n=1 Tax=Aerococcus urinae TaxID=1376 RepID=A0A109REU7_9LACT|nr:sugar transferase [Aerococcus urinae]AMB95979.1 capsular biosynthesis protein [Aerococcus urinae]MCY3033061.1 sugar transferase [Aerococcus urinae]MCY3038205.1 sugar transferase [Aerococcus urinae]MCY3045107.1 sugar transferase [Aerococcus urinae]MCY3046612.1 sugar transferase [Aerococcus urinae]
MYIKVKRLIDFILALIALIILSPLFLLIALWIKLDSKGPVFFKQKRIGKNRDFFYIYKFRSMLSETPADMPTHLLKDPAAFITKSGAFLRKTSLDELPQLINILKGEMAIIGPRPALWNQDDLADERDKYGANDVLPGLSGWAQINGRDELPIDVKARLDGQYVENMGPVMDIKCFFGTFVSVIRHEGVVEGGTGAIEKAKQELEEEDK